MKPAPKFQAAMILYHLGSEGIWEHELFGLLRVHYPENRLRGIREDLVGMSTVGWLETQELCEHNGQILRRYRLADSARPLITYHLDLTKYLATDLPAPTSGAAR